MWRERWWVGWTHTPSPAAEVVVGSSGEGGSLGEGKGSGVCSEVLQGREQQALCSIECMAGVDGKVAPSGEVVDHFVVEGGSWDKGCCCCSLGELMTSWLPGRV